MKFLLLLATCVASVLSALPAQQCGWPAVYSGGRFGPSTVRLAQYLLGNALGYPTVNATGVLNPETISEIKEFQTKVKLTPDGFLGSDTWPLLVQFAVPLGVGSFGPAVAGLQDALTANGFPSPVTSKFDTTTSIALSHFQQARGDSQKNGTVTTSQTWHLLATMCNTTGAFWFDAGWPQGNLSLSTLQCLQGSAGFKFATYECWVEEGIQGSFWPSCVDNIKNSWAAGFQSVGVYMFPQRTYTNAADQVHQLMGNLTAHQVNFSSIMLDVEGSKWSSYSQLDNQAFITELRATIESYRVKVTVYCGKEWPQFFGPTFDSFADLPLVYAHYDNVPSYYDFYPPYGGWAQPAGKQFWDGANGETACGTGAIDWDWSEKPFW